MSSRSPRNAFTLVELLVSMTVLIILVAAVAAMVKGVSTITTGERRHLSSDNEARRVFDRMAYDFAKMAKRSDADNVFASIKGADISHGANDKMFFYSAAPAYYDTTGQAAPTPAQSTMGLIGYRIPNDNSNVSVTNTRWQLERLGKGLTWDLPTAASTPGAVIFLTYPAASPSPSPFSASTFAGVSNSPGTWNGTGAWTNTIGTPPNFEDGIDSNYHVLSSDVFRLEFCFVLKNSTAGQYTTSLTQGQGLSNVSAIIVGLALLDAQGRALLPASVPMSTLAAAFPDPDFTATPPKLMAARWSAMLNAPGAAAALGVPQPVASAIRVYQRTFYLNTP